MVYTHADVSGGMAIFHGRAPGVKVCARTRRCLTHIAEHTTRTFLAQSVQLAALIIPRVVTLLDTPVDQHPSGMWRRKRR